MYIHACTCAHAYRYSHQKSNCAARDTKDRVRVFCIAEISSRLSGIPYVGLCRLSRFLVSLIGHAFHVPQTVCIIFYILWKTKMRSKDTHTHIRNFFPHDFCTYRLSVSLLKKLISKTNKQKKTHKHGCLCVGS